VRVWLGGECVKVLNGHEQSVWSVIALPDGSIVSGEHAVQTGFH
jgi:hypothetical protein